MKIIRDKNGCLICRYNRSKDSDLTWRKVKYFCEKKINELNSSKEFEEIQHYKATIAFLTRKVENFNKRISLYQSMFDSISYNDPDIDLPFVSVKPGDQNE